MAQNVNNPGGPPFQKGTLGAPGISFTGDSTTGIYSGAAQALAIATNSTIGFYMDGGTGVARISFYGHAPIAIPAAYTLNAGAVTRNLASGATLVNVEQTLRQVITDLQGSGLLQ